MKNTGYGASLVLIALGAILAFAVTVETEGFNINTAGLILLAVGAVGLVASFITSNSPQKTVVESDSRQVKVDG